jgi:hypothetical protein
MVTIEIKLEDAVKLQTECQKSDSPRIMKNMTLFI